MADSDIQIPVTGTGDTGPKKVDTRTVGAGADEHRQVVVLGSPTTASDVGGVTAANGLAVDVTRFPTGAKVQLTDGTDDATISVAGSRKPLDIHVIDSAGAVVSSFSGTGGTSATDDADFTRGTTVGTPIMAVYESAPGSITDGDMGIIACDANGRPKVYLDGSSLDVAHDAVDSGNPVKIGGKARTATPAAVANGDRVDASFTTLGQMQVALIDPGQQVQKSASYTATQTGTVLWDPTSGKKIAITSIVIASFGTTAGRVLLWAGANGDTVYTAGTDQLILPFSAAPSTTSKPGIVFTPPTPVYVTTADFELHVTTDAAISIDVNVYGFEWA
jgi:hypothetical protein